MGGKRDVNDIMELPPTASLFYDKRVKKYLGQTAECDSRLGCRPHKRYLESFIALAVRLTFAGAKQTAGLRIPHHHPLSVLDCTTRKQRIFWDRHGVFLP